MTDYKFSTQIKRLSIGLIIIGAIGIAFGFYSAPSNVEEAKEIVASMSHGDGHEGDGHEGDSHEGDSHEGDVMVKRIMEISQKLVTNMIMINTFLINFKTSLGQLYMFQHYFL